MGKVTAQYTACCLGCLRLLVSKCMFRLKPFLTMSKNPVSTFFRPGFAALCISLLCGFVALAHGQTDCAVDSETLDTAQPKGISTQELLQKLIGNEDKV